MKPYPKNVQDTLESLGEAVRFICRTRNEDEHEFINLANVFVAGRKVGKVPASSADIAASDRPGDINYDANYLYLCVDNSGAAWRRIALASW